MKDGDFYLVKLFHSLNLPLHFNKTGNKQFTNYQRISLIVIFRRENKPIRDFVEDLKESKWVNWLGLKKVPKKSTFHDWLELFDMKLIRKLINLSVDKTGLKVTAIDGSGVETNFRSSYYKKRLKQRYGTMTILDFRDFLETISEELKEANKGLLLAPPKFWKLIEGSKEI